MAEDGHSRVMDDWQTFLDDTDWVALTLISDVTPTVNGFELGSTMIP